MPKKPNYPHSAKQRIEYWGMKKRKMVRCPFCKRRKRKGEKCCSIRYVRLAGGRKLAD